MRVIERESGHYEVHSVPYGKVYSWCPDHVLFECECGETLTWTAPVTVCGCGATFTDVESPGPERRRTNEEAYRPWYEEYAKWRREKLANNIQHEYFGFVGTEDRD